MHAEVTQACLSSPFFATGSVTLFLVLILQRNLMSESSGTCGQYVILKQSFMSTRLHGATSQCTVTFVFTAVRISTYIAQTITPPKGCSETSENKHNTPGNNPNIRINYDIFTYSRRNCAKQQWLWNTDFSRAVFLRFRLCFGYLDISINLFSLSFRFASVL